MSSSTLKASILSFVFLALGTEALIFSLFPDNQCGSIPLSENEVTSNTASISNCQPITVTGSNGIPGSAELEFTPDDTFQQFSARLFSDSRCIQEIAYVPDVTCSSLNTQGLLVGSFRIEVPSTTTARANSPTSSAAGVWVPKQTGGGYNMGGSNNMYQGSGAYGRPQDMYSSDSTSPSRGSDSRAAAYPQYRTSSDDLVGSGSGYPSSGNEYNAKILPAMDNSLVDSESTAPGSEDWDVLDENFDYSTENSAQAAAGADLENQAYDLVDLTQLSNGADSAGSYSVINPDETVLDEVLAIDKNPGLLEEVLLNQKDLANPYTTDTTSLTEITNVYPGDSNGDQLADMYQKESYVVDDKDNIRGTEKTEVRFRDDVTGADLSDVANEDNMVENGPSNTPNSIDNLSDGTDDGYEVIDDQGYNTVDGTDDNSDAWNYDFGSYWDVPELGPTKFISAPNQAGGTSTAATTAGLGNRITTPDASSLGSGADHEYIDV